jgi:hypothetical protein
MSNQIEILSSIDSKLDIIINLLSESSNKKSINNETTKSSSRTTGKTASKNISKGPVKGTIIKKGKINIDEYNDCLLISGDTFARKELIKSLGGKWNQTNNGWTIPANNSDEAKEKLELYCESVILKEINCNLVKDLPDLPNKITPSKSNKYNEPPNSDDDNVVECQIDSD